MKVPLNRQARTASLAVRARSCTSTYVRRSTVGATFPPTTAKLKVFGRETRRRLRGIRRRLGLRRITADSKFTSPAFDTAAPFATLIGLMTLFRLSGGQFITLAQRHRFAAFRAGLFHRRLLRLEFAHVKPSRHVTWWFGRRRLGSLDRFGSHRRFHLALRCRAGARQFVRSNLSIHVGQFAFDLFAGKALAA